MKKVVIVSASGVKNLELSQKFEAKLKELGADTALVNLMDLNLPLYTSVVETQHNPKELMGPTFDIIANAHSFVFVSPEYNGGLPPVFTNFLAWMSRSTKDWRQSFNSKTALIASHSGGGTQALTMMRLQLSYIGINVLGRQLAVNASRPVDDASVDVLSKLLLEHTL